MLQLSVNCSTELICNYQVTCLILYQPCCCYCFCFVLHIVVTPCSMSTLLSHRAVCQHCCRTVQYVNIVVAPCTVCQHCCRTVQYVHIVVAPCIMSTLLSHRAVCQQCCHTVQYVNSVVTPCSMSTLLSYPFCRHWSRNFCFCVFNNINLWF